MLYIASYICGSDSISLSMFLVGGGGLGTTSPAAEGSTGRELGVMYSDSSSFSRASSPV